MLWLRLGLPFRLNHVNVWLIRENAGWAIIDTGLGIPAIKDIWRDILGNKITPGKPSRVLATHYHPDHIGCAGWLVEEFGVPFHAPLTEWSYGRMISLLPPETYLATITHYYHHFGLTEPEVGRLREYGNHYARNVTPLPPRLERLQNGDYLRLGDDDWQVMTFGGHTPEHACLYSPARKILLAGDQVLPFISPNISVSFFEPLADPLTPFLHSLEALRRLPEDTLVLPCHGIPFRNLHLRLSQLAEHHATRLVAVLDYCRRTPRSPADIMRHLFPQDLDTHQLMFAVGEAAAHANHLAGQGKLQKIEGDVVRYLDRKN